MQQYDSRGAQAVLPVLEFLAGKCNWDGRMVTPDKRKGKLVLGNGEDTLLRVQWICRTNNIVEDNLIVINDAYLEKVKAAKNGRVYILRFTSSDKKLFFWLQDADSSKDEENVEKFNALIGAGVTSSTAPSGLVETSSNTVSNSTNNAPTQEQASSQPALPSTSQPALPSTSQPALPSTSQPQLPRPVTIASMLHGSDQLRALFEDKAAFEELKFTLPSSMQRDLATDEINMIVHSPQLRHSMNLLTEAIYSYELPILISSMGIPPSNVHLYPDAMQTLVEALEAAVPPNDDVTSSTDCSNTPPAENNKTPPEDTRKETGAEDEETKEEDTEMGK